MVEGQKRIAKRSKVSQRVQKRNGELRAYDCVRIWLKDLEPTTQRKALYSMRIFTSKTGMNPDQFLAFAKSHEPVQVQDLIDKMSEGLKPSMVFNVKVDMRSFLHHNGYNNLPKAKITYTLKDWHEGYNKQQVRTLLGYLDSKIHKMPVLFAAESGLRIRTVLALRYKHVKEDLEAGTVPTFIKLEPEFYHGAKSAGFTFLGQRSVQLLKEAIAEGIVKTEPESLLIPRSYQNLYKVVVRAARKAGLPKQIQVFHGLRKYFDDCMNRADIPEQKKNLLKGRFGGVLPKHYTSREIAELRDNYRKAYLFLDVEQANVEMAVKVQSQEDEVKDLRKELASVQSELTAIRKWMEKKGK